MTAPIRYLLFIDPARYGAIETPEVKKSLGRIVGRINEHPAVAAGRILMMGPGRWGSSNIELGVNVTYADINNTAVLVEMAREEAGQVPEVSYGTHFFLDLVEAQIIYLPVYPSDPEAEFNSGTLREPSEYSDGPPAGCGAVPGDHPRLRPAGGDRGALCPCRGRSADPAGGLLPGMSEGAALFRRWCHNERENVSMTSMTRPTGTHAPSEVK